MLDQKAQQVGGGRELAFAGENCVPAGLTFSMRETVPSDESQRSSALRSPEAADPAALPDATVLAARMENPCMFWPGMFWQSASAMKEAMAAAWGSREISFGST
ncbi:hypothetical protein J2W32_003872 [Variovorax boronicumulans]|uniref:Uncharacterized protein n=1 Tax=Variovorax boronicumulans TaxID=436515 RepID=A0AAW8D4V5_9BURK|nr:hypothetical protein [Variovorax boronicumulans]MDQ0038574.1 hypothetical protein [Variovorax boronicumulans]MDQ0054814.1 hypothetical protein [Variovorax boronicumulans]